MQYLSCACASLSKGAIPAHPPSGVLCCAALQQAGRWMWVGTCMHLGALFVRDCLRPIARLHAAFLGVALASPAPQSMSRVHTSWLLCSARDMQCSAACRTVQHAVQCGSRNMQAKHSAHAVSPHTWRTASHQPACAWPLRVHRTARRSRPGCMLQRGVMRLPAWLPRGLKQQSESSALCLCAGPHAGGARAAHDAGG